MADGGALLAGEISRIISANYAVSLKKLHDITQANSVDVLRRWADAHPCYVPRLARLLLESFSEWPYMVDLLQTFAQLQCMRDAILSQDPAFLQNLLHSATSSLQGFNRFSDLCVSFLSCPLASALPLPDVAQRYLLQLFEAAVQAPEVRNIESIYSALNGAGQELLGILPQGTLNAFCDHLFKIMRNIRSIEDQSLGLLCLGVIATILEAQADRSMVRTPSTGGVVMSSGSDVSDENAKSTAQQFFVGSKAAKTLHLLVLRVIYACKDDVGMPQQDAIRDVRLAVKALQAVDKDTREIWMRANIQVVRKLQEKVIQLGHDLERQLEVLHFLVLLCGLDGLPLPKASFQAYHSIVRQLDELSVEEPSVRTALRTMMPTILPRLPEVAPGELLENAIAIFSEPANLAKRKVKAAEIAMLDLAEIAQDDKVTRARILGWVSSNGAQRSMQRLVSTQFAERAISEVCTGDSMCSLARNRMQAQLGVAICEVVLKAGISAQTDEAGLAGILAISLLEKLKNFTTRASEPRCTSCLHYQKPQILTVIEQEATPATRRKLSNWRDRLAAEIELEIRQRQQSLTRTVGEICLDLEERSESTEAPLREEQARCREIQDQLETARNQLNNIDAQFVDQKLYTDALEAEKTCHENELKVANEEIEDLNRQLELSEEQLRTTRRDGNASLEEALDQARNRELELSAIIASKDEVLELQQGQMNDLKIEIEGLRDQCLSEEQSRGRAEAILEELAKEHADTQKQLKHRLADCETYASRISHQRILISDLERDIEVLQRADGASKCRIAELNKELEVVANVAKTSADNLVKGHQIAMQQLEARMVQAKTAFEEDHRKQEEMQTHTAAAYAAERHNLQASISSLRKELSRITSACRKKDDELAKAQELKGKLISAMGLGGLQAGAVSTVRRAATITLGRTPRRDSYKAHHRQVLMAQSPDMTKSQASQNDQSESPDPRLSSSSFSQSPTPKRQESRKFNNNTNGVLPEEKYLRPRSANAERPRSPSKRMSLQGGLSLNRGDVPASLTRKKTGIVPDRIMVDCEMGDGRGDEENEAPAPTFGGEDPSFNASDFLFGTQIEPMRESLMENVLSEESTTYM